MDDMKVEIWSSLPSEILDHALSFLPVPVLTRFRTVCKRWNKLMCKPEFGALCVQHARQGTCFMVTHYIITGKEKFTCGSSFSLGDDHWPFYGANHGLSFLDVDARRWYRYSLGTGGPIVAMDGGLVCQMLKVAEYDMSVFVSNPIAKTWRKLPALPDFCQLHPTLVVNMVVNHAAQSYKVFVMASDEHCACWDKVYEPFMVVYDSRSDQWWSADDPPFFGDWPEEAEVHVEARHSVFYDGLLYILMHREIEFAEDCTDLWLWSYNHVEDTWTDTGVIVIDLGRKNCQLIVSDERLFLASWLTVGSGPVCMLQDQPLKRWLYEISEINVDDVTCKTVFQIPGEVMAQAFDKPAETLDRDLLLGRAPFDVVAYGVRKSIVLVCESRVCKFGVAIVYDLSTCSWEYLTVPTNSSVSSGDPLDRLGDWSSFGKPMSLLLPASTLWVDHQVPALKVRCRSTYDDVNLSILAG